MCGILRRLLVHIPSGGYDRRYGQLRGFRDHIPSLGCRVTVAKYDILVGLKGNRIGAQKQLPRGSKYQIFEVSGSKSHTMLVGMLVSKTSNVGNGSKESNKTNVKRPLAIDISFGHVFIMSALGPSGLQF